MCCVYTKRCPPHCYHSKLCHTNIFRPELRVFPAVIKARWYVWVRIIKKKENDCLVSTFIKDACICFIYFKMWWETCGCSSSMTDIWRMSHQWETLKTTLQIHSVCAELSDQIAETNLIMSHSTVKLGSFSFTSELLLLSLWPFFLTFAIVHIMVPQESPRACPGEWHR